jgi:uncharacterized protein
MDSRESLICKLRDLKKRFQESLIIDRMVFFGSRNEGRPKDQSDIDLIIVSPDFKGQKFHKRPVRLYEQYDLDYPVDFLCYTPDEFEEQGGRVTIVREALRSGTVI